MDLSPADRPGSYWHEHHRQQRLRRTAAMAAHRAVSAAQVRDVILREFDRGNDGNGDWQVEPTRTARDCWMFKAVTPMAPWPLAVKVYSAAIPQQTVARQFRLLRHYHRAMASRPGLTVPTPWAVMPEQRMLLMEWIDAPRLDGALSRARGSERERIIADAGRWLRHFHDQGGRAERPLQPSHLLRPVDRVLGGEEAVAHIPILRSAYRALHDRACGLGDAPLSYVTGHGDFTPGNLFHLPERTVGFDIAGRQRPLARDLARFLVSAKSDAMRGLRRLWPDSGERDQHVFLAAYGPLPEPIDHRLLALFQLAEVLRRWGEALQDMRRAGATSKSLLKAYTMMRLAQGAAAALRRP